MNNNNSLSILKNKNHIPESQTFQMVIFFFKSIFFFLNKKNYFFEFI